MYPETKYKLYFEHFDDAHQSIPITLPEEFKDYPKWDSEYDNEELVYHCKCWHLNG